MVVAGNIAEFGQNQPLRDHLLGWDDAILVEAAPRDQIWGIGFCRNNPAVHDPLRWPRRTLIETTWREERMCKIPLTAETGLTPEKQAQWGLGQ